MKRFLLPALLLCFSATLTPLYAQVSISVWKRGTSSKVRALQTELNTILSVYPTIGLKPEEMLRKRVIDAENGPFIWCAPMQTTGRQLCTFRIGGVHDDSINSWAERITFQQSQDKTKLLVTRVDAAWKCNEGRGKSDDFHITVCK